MKFSCVITTFNDGPILRLAVSSVLNQTDPNFELIVVNDGSGPETKDILDGFDDPRLKVLEQANDGLSSARNRGLQHVTGDYVCFLDGDDVRAPWSFAEARKMIEASAPEVILVAGITSELRHRLHPFYDSTRFENFQDLIDDGEEVPLPTRKAIASAMEPQMANKFIARDLLTRAAMRFPNDHFFEDILFHVLCIAHAQSIAFLPHPHFTYFRRALRPQLTGSNSQIRFDTLGTTRVLFDLFQMHPDFTNAPQRGAVAIGALRLLRWCESLSAHNHRSDYRASLRQLFRSIHPSYFAIDEKTPGDPAEISGIIDYVKEVMA